MNQSTLYIFSGLPATGKSTLAFKLAEKTNAFFLRIDTVEQGLREVCGIEEIEGMGYRLSYRIAKDNLLAGNNVIADSVNPWELTRKEWNEVATSVGSKFINIEVICSDESEHKMRVETRKSDVPNLKLPTWKEVVERDYHPWSMERIVIDTAGKSVEESYEELLEKLNS